MKKFVQVSVVKEKCRCYGSTAAAAEDAAIHLLSAASAVSRSRRAERWLSIVMLRTVWLVATVAVFLQLQQLQPVTAEGVVSSTVNGGAPSVLSSPQLEYWKTVSVSSRTADKAQAATTPPSSSSVCSVEQLLNDPCSFSFDGVCDANEVLCAVQTDCFDCDPCQTIVNDAIDASIVDPDTLCGLCSTAGCLFCTAPDHVFGGFLVSCTSPAFASLVPNTCVNSGGTEFSDTCSSTVVDMPTPTLYICQRLRYDGCDVCVAAGCYWCASDAACLSSNPISTANFGNATIGGKQLTCTNFTQTCPTSNVETDLYEDPLFHAQSWVFDQIGVRDVWKSGISTFATVHSGWIIIRIFRGGANSH
jgi:hypothetical protein